MITFKFEKLYKNDRINEPCMAAVPFAKGVLRDCRNIVVERNQNPVPIQCKVTAKWEDGSAKWVLIRFLADLPGNTGTEYLCNINGQPSEEGNSMVSQKDGIITMDTNAVRIRLTEGKRIFDEVTYQDVIYPKECFDGPVLVDGMGNTYDLKINEWQVIEDGPICAIIKGLGYHILSDGTNIACEIRLTAYINKPWVELAYRIINTTYEPLHLSSLAFNFQAPQSFNGARTCVASSNYATSYTIGENGETVEKVVDVQSLLYEGNEHTAEVFYGTLFADYNNEKGGLCATVYQAQQNYPKAVKAHSDGLTVSLVPKNVDEIVMQSGMARQQKMLLHFHDGRENLENLNNRSIIYQMPDRPVLDPQVYRDAKVLEDVFVDYKISDVEMKLIACADNHARCYGMLNWGDSPDPGYSLQGRGGGASVWTNNEYDFSHACTLMYVRTGTRRFLDYMLVSSKHWMDVDVCHFSDNPLIYGGQWEHSLKHCIGSHMACSHEWVAGLLDYYHFTGEEEGLDTAIGIGNNVMRLLNSPEFQSYGALHARETGWALRTLVDLYNETNDENWLIKCDWIVGHFEDWERKYGLWLAPYTDNTVVRVVFMIAVAINSLMRYYRIKPNENVKEMIIRAIDDLVENCRMEGGLFYYKELPSLQKPSNPNILEALTIAYELTGDVKYLEAGMPTFKLFMDSVKSVPLISKRIEGDALIHDGEGTKSFAQPFWPVVTFYKAATDNQLM